MKLTEKIVAFLALLSVSGSILLVPGAGILLVVTLSFLSMMYLYFSFALFNGIRLRKIFRQESYSGVSKKRIIVAIFAGLALSTGLFGLLFRFQSWPGASVNLRLGMVTLLAVSIVAFIKYRASGADFHKTVLKRTVSVLIPVLILIALPKDSLLDFKYRDYPAYLEAIKDSRADPYNEELREREKDERQKMYEAQVK